MLNTSMTSKSFEPLTNSINGSTNNTTVHSTTTVIHTTTVDPEPKSTVCHTITSTVHSTISIEGNITTTSTINTEYDKQPDINPACLAMGKLAIRNIRKVCISTALLSLIFLLHIHIFPEDNPKFTSKTLLWTHDRAQGRPLPPRHQGPLFATSQRNLPPSFRVIDTTRNESETQPHFPFTCTTSKCEPNFTICVYETAIDRYISGALLTSGIWEPFITSAFQKALSRLPGATVIDIGANIGYYSLMASSRNHDVIAVEPYGENQKRLAAGFVLTMRQYPGAGRIKLLGNAMSDRHRLVGLHKCKDNQGGLRVMEACGTGSYRIVDFLRSIYTQCKASVTAKNDEVTRRCDIPTLTMDDLLLVIDTDSAVIKVDVEGYECRAMGEAFKFLTTIQVPYIFMEWRLMTERQHDYDTPCPTDRIRQLSTTLSDLGYEPHEIQSGIRLNPFTAPDWHVDDIYWRKRDQNLLVPPM